VLTWNRRAFDFSEQDRQLFQFIGLRLDVISRRIEQRQQLEKSWRTLAGFIDTRMPTESVASLGEHDGILLAELLKQKPRIEIARLAGIRRDSIDKRLGSIRERLGLENHHQLLSALVDLRNQHP
jgi:DNA-binding CsgD family transcriptional regulator